MRLPRWLKPARNDGERQVRKMLRGGLLISFRMIFLIILNQVQFGVLDLYLPLFQQIEMLFFLLALSFQ